MKKVYILTTYTGTVLSYLISRVTKVPYAHVSIALDENLEEVYSFGRKHVSNPIFAGFVREYIDGGLYKKMHNTQCRVYSLELKDSQYSKLVETINVFVANKKKFKYDATALIRLLCGIPNENNYKFVCSQFVAFALEESGVNIFNKPSKTVTPMDFYTSKLLNVEYEGLLCEYRSNLNSNTTEYSA